MQKEIIGKDITVVVKSIIELPRGIQIFSDKLANGGRSMKYTYIDMDEITEAKLTTALSILYPGAIVNVYVPAKMRPEKISAEWGTRVTVKYPK